MAANIKQRSAYVGDTKKQLRDGYGIYVYENSFFRYEGEWKDGKKHGHGKLIMNDGSYYEGEFEDGEIEGHGLRYYAASKNTYTGKFHLGELQGQGVMKYADGSVYEGEWKRNTRCGFGVFRNPDNSMYQGYLHDNKRHGEGTQIYGNGDRYDGDWVQDKRQGHGEIRCRDGTIYAGQWSNDMFNGQGTLVHSSGMNFEGLWVNGMPSVLSKKLVLINKESPIEVVQGVPFTIEVQCQDDEGYKIEDMGRDLSIFAGFRHKTKVEGQTDETNAKKLFDMIEEVEETPIPTPFGYSVVSYPITDQFPYEEGEDPGILSSFSRSNTSISEITGEQEPTASAENETKEAVGITDDGRSASPTVITSSDALTTSADPSGLTKVPTDDQPLPPHPNNQRTEKGLAVFNNLVLPAPPLMYRPYILLDEEEKVKRNKSRQGKDDSRPTTKASKKALGDDRFSRPGEYVIKIEDNTNPPFLGQTVEPLFILVKVVAPKKLPKVQKKKDKGPKSGRLF